MSNITQRALRAMDIGQWHSEPVGAHGQGSLQARRLVSGIHYYYRHGARGVRYPLTDDRGAPLSLAEARRRARQMALRTRAGHDGEASLGALMGAYCDRLQADGKASASEVRALIRRHVQQAHPALWRTPARRIGREDVLAILHPLVERDQLPSAAKLRAALHAAYQEAVRVSCDARGQALLRFRVSTNPVAAIQPIRGSHRARSRVLGVDELAAYWRHLAPRDGVVGVALRLHMLLGGQRVAQLLRLTRRDVYDDSLVLYDAKGRRREPRLHRIPLIAPARAEIARLDGNAPYLLSADGGRNPLTPTTLRRHVQRTARQMCRAGEAGEGFCLSDIRRSTETRLAALGISRDIRAHLLSHDLGGVQDRHYDAHDYQTEMRDALSALYEVVSIDTTGTDNVVALHSARGRQRE